MSHTFTIPEPSEVAEGCFTTAEIKAMRQRRPRFRFWQLLWVALIVGFCGVALFGCGRPGAIRVSPIPTKPAKRTLCCALSESCTCYECDCCFLCPGQVQRVKRLGIDRTKMPDRCVCGQDCDCCGCCGGQHNARVP